MAESAQFLKEANVLDVDHGRVLGGRLPNFTLLFIRLLLLLDWLSGHEITLIVTEGLTGRHFRIEGVVVVIRAHIPPLSQQVRVHGERCWSLNWAQPPDRVTFGSDALKGHHLTQSKHIATISDLYNLF